MRKTSLKTRIMSIVAAAVMTCSVAAVSMASASAASVDTRSVGMANKTYTGFGVTSSIESKEGSYLAAWVWDENGNGEFVKANYHHYGSKIDFGFCGNYVGAIFVRVKGYAEPNWNNGSIMAQSRNYSVNELKEYNHVATLHLGI